METSEFIALYTASNGLGPIHKYVPARNSLFCRIITPLNDKHTIEVMGATEPTCRKCRQKLGLSYGDDYEPPPKPKRVRPPRNTNISNSSGHASHAGHSKPPSRQTRTTRGRVILTEAPLDDLSNVSHISNIVKTDEYGDLTTYALWQFLKQHKDKLEPNAPIRIVGIIHPYSTLGIMMSEDGSIALMSVD